MTSSIVQKPPGRLYKYQLIDDYTLRNIERHVLYFKTPKELNDPYDCFIHVERALIADGDRLNKLYRLQHDKDEDKIAFMLKYSSDGMPNATYKNAIRNGAQDAFNASRKHLRNDMGVTCFAETNLDMLMWSHYADKHTGFCLEFDTTFAPFSDTTPVGEPRIRKVQYHDEIPTIDAVDILLDWEHGRVRESGLLTMVTTKAACPNKLTQISKGSCLFGCGTLRSPIDWNYQIMPAHKKLVMLLRQGP